MPESQLPGRGFVTTFRTMFKKVTTEEYPEEVKTTAPRFHGRHVLNRHPDGLEKYGLGGTKLGHDGVRAFLARVPSVLGGMRLEPQEFIEQGDRVVVEAKSPEDLPKLREWAEERGGLAVVAEAGNRLELGLSTDWEREVRERGMSQVLEVLLDHHDEVRKRCVTHVVGDTEIEPHVCCRCDHAHRVDVLEHKRVHATPNDCRHRGGHFVERAERDEAASGRVPFAESGILDERRFS